ncbi:hypothetical protein CDL12_09775 [Handroanthus impetiginosus]|uniref:Uncharacterized protein n=1 Tax=Handroanthus impetiginosus TaxID=429701 RepID=A0A2G9HJ53_9LAMI|nr:hypothetical protein CDL12_09775 [Handroanthus impetiginosus]
MAEEIAALVVALSSDDFSEKLRSDASASVLRLGFQKLYSILRQSVKPVDFDNGGDDGKTGSQLGLEVWDQARVHALACVAIAVVKAVRSLSIEQVEPVAVAVAQQSIEFALCYLEKWIGKSDDSSLQNIILQLLELLLADGMHKELDLSQPCPTSVAMDLLPTVADKDGAVQWQEHAKCMLRGCMCSQEKETDDYLLMASISECLQGDTVNAVMGRQSFPSNADKLGTLCQHWATVHLRCIHRLILCCKELLEIPVSMDEKQACLNLRRRLSACVRIFKLLGSLTKDNSFVSDNLLLQSAASFIDVLPSLYGTGVEFTNSNTVVESSFESLAVHLLEEFLQIMQSAYCKNYAFCNIQASAAASILQNLDSDVWRSNKSGIGHKFPLACSPRVVIFVLKLVSDIKDQEHHIFELDNLAAGRINSPTELDSPSCHVCGGEVLLLKKYTVEELFGIMFPSSAQWLDNLIHLVLVLHSEGVRLRPILERSCSRGTKTSATSEAETIVCHEDEALFGDLFSEGNRSVASADGCEQSNAGAGSISCFSNMAFQAATELLNFLKICVFSPQWHPQIHQDALKKLNGSHIDIFLSILNCQGCYPEDRTCDNSPTLHEERMVGQLHQVCFELLQKLVMLRAFSVSLEESIVDNILIVKDGAHIYNDQTLALLAHILVCRVGSNGSSLRSKIYQMFVKFIHQKAKTVCSMCPGVKEIVDTLPSLFHMEILLIAFHFSSEEEKAVLANEILSSLKTIDVPSAGSDSIQLSCWGLLISRLVLVLRHMIYHPRACPSLLLLDFRTRLREAPAPRIPNATKYLSSWPAIALEDMISSTDTPANINLLNQLIDITPLPASLCGDYPACDCLGLNWEGVCASFSEILGYWNGKNAANTDDLIIERYLFVLCWDVPVEGSSSELQRSATSEAETIVCHEDEALFGDLFSEGNRSVASADGCEQSNAGAGSISCFSNMAFQAATELLNFLKICVFSPQWHPQIHQDALKKLNGSHIDIFLSILNCQGCYPEDRTCDNSPTLHEERMVGQLHQVCFELLQKLVMLRAFSVSLEESIVDNILIVKDGAHIYNDQTLALLAHILVCRVGSNGSSLRSKIYQMFVKFIHQKAKTVCSMCPGVKEIVDTLPSLFHMEILLIAFHFSSEEEKAVLANEILSSLKTIDVPSAGSDSIQLSCWGLLISRLVLVLRHMIYHPRACPSLLLLDFRTRLREAPAPRIPNATKYLSSWPAIALEDMISSTDTPANINLLNQLIDITPLPASLCGDYPACDCLGLNWEGVCASFSEILGYWNGKNAANTDDLIIERYLFVLCWDVPVEGSSSELQRVLSSGLQLPDILNMKNFIYISHSILGQRVTSKDCTGIPELLLNLLQNLHGSLMCEDVGKLGWNFLRSG